jgi:hypothetical protein
MDLLENASVLHVSPAEKGEPRGKATVTIVAGGYRLCPDAYGHDLVGKPDKSIEIQDRLEIRLL